MSIDKVENDPREIQLATELFNLLAKHKTTYSIEERLTAAMHYADTGNYKKVSERMNVSYQTISSWKNQDWWPLALQHCRMHKQDELDGMLSRVVHNAIAEIADRILDGDYYVKKTEPWVGYR